MKVLMEKRSNGRVPLASFFRSWLTADLFSNEVTCRMTYRMITESAALSNDEPTRVSLGNLTALRPSSSTGRNEVMIRHESTDDEIGNYTRVHILTQSFSFDDVSRENPEAYDDLVVFEIFKTSFRMSIHTKETTKTRLARLDTDSPYNIVSQGLTTGLPLDVEPYQGPDLRSFVGPYIRPIGQTTFDWHVSQRQKSYRSTFFVVESQLCGKFDLLLGREEISKLGFDRRDSEIW